jgi:hypothetical protein
LRPRLLWSDLANPFRAVAILGFVGWAFLIYSVYPWVFFVLSVLPSLTLKADLAGLFLESLVFAFIIGLATVPLTGGLALLLIRMPDDRRGIVALFVTFFSFFPLVFLGFELLGWILQQWQLATVALLWTPIAWMMIRILRRRRVRST